MKIQSGNCSENSYITNSVRINEKKNNETVATEG